MGFPVKKFLFVGFIILVITSCSSTGTDKKNNNGSHDFELAAENYMPLQNGTIWTYSSIKTNPVTGITDSTSLIISIAGTTMIDFNTYKVMIKQNGDSTLVRIQDNAIYVYDTKYIATDKSPKAAGMIGSEYPYYRFGLSANTTYEVLSGRDSGKDWSKNWTVETTYHGLETVEVPKGIYENCALFEVIITVSRTRSGINETTLHKKSTWFAHQIGPIKITEETKIDGILQETILNKLSEYLMP